MMEYKTGYKKPPKEYQFKPGQSGNKNGRPKKVKDWHTMMQEELNSKSIVWNSKKLTVKRALIKRMIQQAFKDNKSMRLLIDFIAKQRNWINF